MLDDLMVSRRDTHIDRFDLDLFLSTQSRSHPKLFVVALLVLPTVSNYLIELYE